MPFRQIPEVSPRGTPPLPPAAPAAPVPPPNLPLPGPARKRMEERRKAERRMEERRKAEPQYQYPMAHEIRKRIAQGGSQIPPVS